MGLPVRDTLATLREEVKDRLGFGGSGTAFTANNNLIDSWLRACQRKLYWGHDFSELEVIDETTQAQEGQHAYDWPDDIEPKKISKIWCKDSSITTGNFFLMDEGITGRNYGLVTSADYDRPRKYVRSSQLKVWPYPDSNNYYFVIKGIQRLNAFTADSDRATIEEELILELAVALGKGHYRHPDAPNYQAFFIDMLKDIKSGDMGTERFVRPSGSRFSYRDSFNSPDMVHRNTLDE
jgi:hypothetical protein